MIRYKRQGGVRVLENLYIDNFKAMNDFNISFSPVTIIIGANAAGKSTILNAIIFLKYCCTESTAAYLENERLSVSDLCSKFVKKQSITFITKFNINDQDIVWRVRFIANKTTNTLKLGSEIVTINNNEILNYSISPLDIINKKKTFDSYRINEATGEKEEIMRGSYSSSMLSILDENDPEFAKSFPTMLSIKKFFTETDPCDLLSPKDMRESARGITNTIGRNGKKLAAFIKNMNSSEKKELVKDLKTVFPNIVDINAVIHGQPGWASIEIQENYSNRDISVSSRNVSDGVLRLVAFFAMKYHKSSGGVTLLDEIENGINSEIMESLLKAFQERSLINKQQLIATTHSTVLLDYIEPKSIRYIFRDKSGTTTAYNPFENSELKNKLEYMYPGEIILNTSNQQLGALYKHQEGED